MIESVILHGGSRPANVKLPPCCCVRIEVDPEGSTIIYDGGRLEHDEDSFEIRWRHRAHADLRLHEGFPVGDVSHDPISALPSIRSWTSIITVDVGMDVGTADTVLVVGPDDFIDVGATDVTIDGALKGETVFCVDGAAERMTDGVAVGGSVIVGVWSY